MRTRSNCVYPCRCGGLCGQLTVSPGTYHCIHASVVFDELKQACECGCGELTSGLLGHGGEITKRVRGHGTYNLEYQCRCGCGRRVSTEGRYAYWHVKNSIDELRLACACGCGSLTSGKVSTLGLPFTRIHHHNARTHKSPSDKLCKCGCGRRVSKHRPGWEYASWHTKHSCHALEIECGCGCGKKTTGRIHPNTGKVIEYCDCHHAAGNFDPEHYTDIEILAKGVLEKHGVPFIHNHRIGFFFVDFALPGHVALECDGDYWHALPESVMRDKRKNTFLKNNGWSVVRIKGSELYAGAEEAIVRRLKITA